MWGQFGSVGRAPVQHIVTSPVLAERVALYQAADVFIATPLREGSTLAALEYVAARDNGVLILSEFTGTASSLPCAHVVNPYDDGQVRHTLLATIVAGGAERQTRTDQMRRYVREYDNHAWAASFLQALQATQPPSTIRHGSRLLPRRPRRPQTTPRPPGQLPRGGP